MPRNGENTLSLGTENVLTMNSVSPAPLGSVRAAFNPLIRPYLVLSIAWYLLISIVGIPFAILWIFGVGQWWARHYFIRLECDLTPRMLRYRKGIFFTIEKTIPLENIQDVTFIEGPVLRKFNLSILEFETAGQSAGQAHQMKLISIINAHDFRTQILAARDELKRSSATRSIVRDGSEQAHLEALRAIHGTLEEILASLKDTQRKQ